MASLLQVTTVAQALEPTTPPGTITPVEARPADALVEAFGVQTHLGYAGTPYADVARIKQALVSLGVRHVRDNLNSGKPATYAAMREVASAGIRFNLIMGRPGSWDTPANLVKT